MKTINKKLKNFKCNNIDNEQWKYTNIKKFGNFSFSNLNTKNKITYNSKYDIIIKYNDFFCSKKLNKNISVSYLSNAIKNNDHHINKKFKEMAEIKKNPFIDINKKNNKDGILINIQDNCTIKKPVKIKFETNENITKKFINSKIFILIGKNVEVTIITDEYFDKCCYINSFIELFINENSNVDLIQCSQKKNTTQIFNFLCTIKKDATLNLLPIDINVKLIKKNYYVSLSGTNSSCNYNSLNLLNKFNHIDNYISINHKNNHTFSSTNHKNILSEKSTGIFYAKAIIQNKSYNSQANQNNNNLMLSDSAVVHSNPQLEIYNNDVKCSHGSTTGEIDEEALFYMQSRGIKKQECKKIILHGFAHQVINHISKYEIKNEIEQKINVWLKNVY